MRATEKLKRINERCLNCRNYTERKCKGINRGKCDIADPVHIKKEDWWENDER